MNSQELRKKYIEFWTSPPRNAKEVPNVSLVPNNDPTLLFVNSGMFPINPYLSGQPHPLGTRLCNIQRCLRTNYDEMLEIGDNRHTLMFEMMGDWSLGDFTKNEQIPWIMEFWVGICGMDPKRIYVSVFEGNEDVPRDEEAIKIWKETYKKYGIDAEFSEDITNIPANLDEGMSWKFRIFPYPKKKNWWQRASDAVGELGGPTSEMFYDMGNIEKEQENYHVNDDSGRFIEIGNNVFMEYRFNENEKWERMQKKNIDFGGGFERVAMIIQSKKDIYETDIYEPIIKRIEEISNKDYKTNNTENDNTRYFRILADHTRAATFILADGVIPSNKDQGYVLRRFIRRLVRYGIKLGIESNFTKDLAKCVIEKLSYAYKHLYENQTFILDEILKEEVKFRKTLDVGLREIKKLQQNGLTSSTLTGNKAFYIYETYGFPIEMIFDELEVGEEDAMRIQEEFRAEIKKHRENSRSGAEQKFKGGLADHSAETTKLHTAHHLLLKALQMVLGEDVKQRGSNITAERLRIDFNYNEKLTDEQIKQVEDIVNEKIKDALPVNRVEMSKNEAQNIGAQMEFGQKYPETVSVYYIGENLETAFSKEFCGGPHVSNTKELGASFKIIKQESSGSGVRRIKAILK